MLKIPTYIRYVFFVFASILALTLAYRGVFFFFNDFNQLQWNSELKRALLLGIRFDIRLAAICTLPLALFVFFLKHSHMTSRFFKGLSTVYFTLVYLGLSVFYAFDFGYYDYLEIRLDASSLRFFDDFAISSQMLWESYPIVWGVLFLVMMASVGALLHKKNLLKILANPHKTSKRLSLISKFVTFIGLVFLVYNSFTHYPLRWSEAFFSQKNKINQLALNPVLFFFDSFSFRSEGFDYQELKKYYPAIAKHLNLPMEEMKFERQYRYPDSTSIKPNVVFVMLESVGVKGLSYYGNSMATSPNFDNIISKGIQFTNFFTDKGGTAGSVFASITGLPDIDNVSTASRNPLIINQRILMNQFDGYEKLYFLGGSANWANIRGVFDANIEDLQIFEEGSYAVEKRADVWGMDDYELFKAADTELKKLFNKEKPFVAYIQTATNHRPYTYPDKKEAFEALHEADLNPSELEASGFKSLKQLNALRYLDFNIGRFIERTKASGYFNNTVFVFFGDHNSIMNPSSNYKEEYQLNLTFKHIPFVIYAPGIIESKKIERQGMLIDLFPTVMGLLQINHTNYTLGRNLLDTISYKSTSSFVYLKENGEPTIGILKDSLYLKKKLITKKTTLYDFKKSAIIDPRGIHEKKFLELDSLTMGYYHATKYLYFNNKKTN